MSTAETQVTIADHAHRDATRPINRVELTGNEAMLPNTIRDVQITQLDHGYVVHVGCQRFAIENASILIAKLTEYVYHPAATEQKWKEGKLF